MKKIIFIATLMCILSGCSAFDQEKMPDIFCVEPGLFMPDVLSITYNPDANSNGLMEIFPGSWGNEASELERRVYEYGDLHNSGTHDYQKWLKSHATQFNKLRENELSRYLKYYYLGVKSIKISANIKINEYDSGTDISKLFKIYSFGVDYKRIFTYPNCDLAFKDSNYLPKTIEEFCSVSPLYMKTLVLTPVFELGESENKKVEYTVTIIVDDEFMGERQLQGVSQYGPLSSVVNPLN